MLEINLSGHTAIVTGGSNGIGAACVSSLQKAGARVVSVDLVEPSMSRPDIHVAGDVTDAHIREQCLDHLGHEPAILVNNAARQLEQRLPVASMDDVQSLFAVNIFSAITMTQAFAARATAGSSIVNIASILGVTGDPALAIYSLTKGAMVNFTRTAALEYAGRVRVNAVLPGAIRTPLTTRAWDQSGDAEGSERRMTALYPVGRIGEPEDVGALVAFLSSPLASFMTGALVPVDGGILAANAEWALERL